MADKGLKRGPNFVPSYQVSGTPFVTGSTATGVPNSTGGSLEINFPFVTRWVMVQNTGQSGLRMGFSANGVQGLGEEKLNFWTIPSGTQQPSNNVTPMLELRCKKLYFAGEGGTTGVQVIAGLTGIAEFPVLTGSDGFDGIG